MTTVYGAWVPNGTTNQRMRLRVDYTVPTPTAGQTSITVTGSVYVEAGYSFNDSSNTFAWSGSLLGSGSTAKSINVATGGAQQIHTFSQAVTLTDEAQSKYVSFSLTGVDYVGASNVASVTATMTIPAKVVSPPNAPTGATVTRVSDARHDLAWSVSTSGTQPVTSFDLERWSLSTNTYASIGSQPGAARAYSDTGTGADNEYEWRIRSRNAAGVSAWTYFPVVWTTPDAPTNVVANRVGSDLVVSWTINALDATHQDLRSQSSTDGGVTWSAWSWITGHTAFSKTLTTRTVTGGLDPTKLHRIGVVASRSNPNIGIPDLYGYSAPSAPVQLLTAPNAPLLLAPLGVVATNAATVMQWQHRPVDTTAQTAAELQYRLVGGSWTTLTATTAQQLTIAANTLPAGNYEWQVRTKGAHASWSPYSALGSFRVAAPPALTITAPGATVTSNKLTLTVAYSDAQGAAMTGWSADLSQAGQIIETVTGTGATTSIPFQTTLVDGVAYTAQARATSGTGLTSAPANWSGTADFLEPPVPTITAAWDEPNGTTQLVVNAPAPGAGEVAATSMDIQRSDDGGLTWATIAAALPLGAGWGDDMVALNLDAQYRAVSVAALGTRRYSTAATVTTTSQRVWLQSAAGRVWILHDLKVSPTPSQARVMETYLGASAPTAHYGTSRPLSIAVSGVWLDEELVQDEGVLFGVDVFYRDPTGRAFWASVESVPMSEPYSERRDVSLTVERVTHG